MRAYAGGTQRRLIIGGLMIITILGTGLIWWIYGFEAARLAMLCIMAGLVPGFMIVAWLWLLDKFLGRARDE